VVSIVGVCALCRLDKESKVLDTLNKTRHRSERTAIKASGKGSILRVALLLMWMCLTETSCAASEGTVGLRCRFE